MYQCCKKCCCQNNMEEDVGPLETSCSDVQSYEENNEDSCQCGFGQEMNLFPTNPMLAQSYVPTQYMDKTVTPCCGLQNGAIFPELVTTYYPGQSMMEIEYLRSRNSFGKGCQTC